jgi:hypothetical protein
MVWSRSGRGILVFWIEEPMERSSRFSSVPSDLPDQKFSIDELRRRRESLQVRKRRAIAFDDTLIAPILGKRMWFAFNV